MSRTARLLLLGLAALLVLALTGWLDRLLELKP